MPELGDTLGRYTLLKKLATGGMGEIYLAARMGPLGFASPVAMKVLRDELATDVTFIEMLVDEAKISMFLNHQNVVSVQDFGEDKGTYYIAMEFIQGVTLKNILDALKAKGRRLDLAAGVYIANELCRALKYAHTRTNHAGEPLNIVHRDVTPANVLISIQGEVKLTDFGIARAKNRVHQTQAGVIKGKFGYMAPEMLRYEQIDARADLFCAGVLMYEMACGQHPVEGATIMEAITRLEEKDIRPPSNFNKVVPRELDQVIMKALEPKPAQRWASAHELSQALQELGFIDQSRRIDIRHGSEQVVTLLRELFPTAFDPALPREHADRMFAVARQRSSLAPAPPSDARSSGRPPIDAGRSGRTDPARPAHERADGEPPTIIPRQGRAHTPTGPSDYDTDEHSKNRLAEAAEDATRNFAAISDEDRRGIIIRPEDEQELPTGEMDLRFPDSSTDRARLRDELLDEPDRPPRAGAGGASSREAIEWAHAEERTYASPDGRTGRGEDGPTVSGMELPDWNQMIPGRGVQVMEPSTDHQQDAVRDFSEDELPQAGERASSYDDGATAFGGPEGFPGHGYSDDKTAFGVTSEELAQDDRTIVPGHEGHGHPTGEKFTDDTLLDGLSRDEIDRAKAEINAARGQTFEHQDDDVGDTALKQEGLVDDALVAALTAEPPGMRRPLGRTASASSGERPNPASSAPPIARPSPRQPARPAAREAPRAVAPDPASRPPNGPGAPDIGNATGRWMRGELAAQDLSWGDDAAARRAVATRNAGPSQPPPDPRRTNVGAPRPAGPQFTPQMMGQPGMIPGIPQGMPPGMIPGPNGMMPFPPQTAARAGNKLATLGVALATVLVAVAAVWTVVTRTQVAWPSVTVETEPGGASVWIDDKLMADRTPATFPVRPNAVHQIEVRLDGYSSRKIPPVELFYKRKKVFSVPLERMKPKLRIGPVAGRVFVNDVEIGTNTEFTLENLDPGSQIRLRVEADGYVAWSLSFARLADMPPSIDVPLTLQPPPPPAPKQR